MWTSACCRSTKMSWYHKVRWDVAVNRRCEAERSGGQIDQDQPPKRPCGSRRARSERVYPARANPCHILLVVSHHDNGILYGEADHVSPKELTASPDTIVANITFPGSCVRTGGRVCAARRLCINIVARGLRENCPTSERDRSGSILVVVRHTSVVGASQGRHQERLLATSLM